MVDQVSGMLRVFLKEILGWSANKFSLERFDFVDDAGDLHKNIAIDQAPRSEYGCGIYTLKKLA